MKTGISADGVRTMKERTGFVKAFLALAVACVLGLPLAIMSQSASSGGHNRDFDEVIEKSAREAFQQGRRVFRFDTFGDEAFWGGSLKLHQAIAGSKLGGVG